MPGRRWTPEERAAFHRLATGEATDVADLVAKLSAEIGRAVTRASVESLLLRAKITASDVVRAHARHEPKPKVDEPAPVVKEPEPRPAEPLAPAEEGSAAPGCDTLVALLFDLHVPEQDRPAVNAALRWVQAEQPQEIILSEPMEWASASMHGGNWNTSWEKDKADGRRFLIQLRSIAPRARIIWQQSNHDTRLDRILEQLLPSFAGSMTIPRELGFDDLGIEWVNERTVLRRGATKIIHGHQLATNARSGLLPKYHAARACLLYGEPGVTVVYGHVHKEQTYVEPCDGGFRRARSLGCLRTLRPAWHRAAEMGHHHQIGALYVSAGGGTNLYAVDIQGGTFTFGGRRYAA